MECSSIRVWKWQICGDNEKTVVLNKGEVSGWSTGDFRAGKLLYRRL